MDGSRFSVRDEIGRGAMGVVYRALDRETGVELALKRLHAGGPEQASALRREFRSLADVEHENLVELYELFATGASSFFTMELVPGTPLLPHLRRGHDVVAPLLQLTDGLMAIHAAGKLHRDVKPSNVLVTPEGRVVVLDFGLATAAAADGDGPGELRGTPRYMAPELLWGKPATPAADWYALGAMLHEAFAGTLPFEGEPAQMLAAKMRGPAPAPLALCPQDIAGSLGELIRELLAPVPERRPDGRTVRRALEALHRHEARAPRPAAMAALRPEQAVTLVGRDDELARLGGLLTAARERLVVAVVRGVSGVGKTDLVRRFVHDARADGALVLTGRCHPQETVPYRGFDDLVDGFGRMLAADGVADPVSMTPGQAAALLHVFPVLGQVPSLVRLADVPAPIADVQELRRQGFAALRGLMRRVAGARPLVVWVDDVQWSDADGAALLRELVAAEDPMLILLSARSETSEPPALIEACDRPQVIDVRPLPTDAACRLVRAVLPAATEDAVSALASEAGGVPFLIMQLAGSPDDGRPVRLADAVRHRVEALPEPARRLLATVAVASSPLDRTVALEASGLGEAGRPVIAALQRRRLLRVGGVTRAVVETYHDRIRETVAAGLDPTARARHHQALAVACEARDGFEPAWLAEQWLGAGDAERASVWATVAGDRAAEALAFAEAARLYRAARTWAPGTEGRTGALLVKEGTALLNAGRCAEAAPCFLEAAAGASHDEALELRRRAAEQFLGAGELERASEVLRPLFRDIGLSYPRSPTRALARGVGWLAHHWVRSVRTTPPQRAATSRDRVRIDTCYSGSRSLSSIEPPIGIYLALRGLALAREVDDRVREGRMLVLVGAALRSLDGAVGRWGRRFMEEAERIADATGDPYLSGIVATAMAQVHLVTGQWRAAVASADRGVRMLTAHCRGVSAECAVGRMAALRASEELGAIGDMRARAAAMLAAARDDGDRFAEVTSGLNVAFGRLASGDTDGARLATRDALGQWTQDTFNMQHLYAVRVEAMCDLYEGQAGAAAARLDTLRRPLRRSGLLRVPLPRVDATMLDARVALATRRWSVAQTCARRLAGEDRADASAHAIAIGALLAHHGKRRGRAADMLGEAATIYRSAGMEVYAFCAERRGAEVSQDAATVAAVDDRLWAAGIAEPARWVDVYLPLTTAG